MNEKAFMNYVASNLWAIIPEKLEEFITKIVQAYKDKAFIDEKTELSFKEAVMMGRYEYEIVNGVAIIPLNGVVEKNYDIWMHWFKEGISTDFAQKTIETALDDSSVDKILLQVDSPGGTINGTKELSDFIFESRKKKPIMTYADSLMASAAYWFGSSASDVYSFDTAYVGSIGVYILHADWSKYLDEIGIKITHIQAGKYKTVGSPYKPLTSFDKDVLQDRVDKSYNMFTEDVARNRREGVDYVKKNMADGKIFNGREALSQRLIDGLMLVDDLLNKMSGNNNPSNLNLNVEDSMGKISAESLQKDNPEVYNEILEAGKALGTSEAKAKLEPEIEKAKTDSIKTEQDRAKDILALAGDDQKELALKLYSEGKTVEEAKTELLKDAQATKAKGLEDFATSAPEAASEDRDEKVTMTQADAYEAKYDNDEKFAKLYEEKGEKEALISALTDWKAKAEIRKEFGGNIKSFLADRRNNPDHKED